MKSTEYRALIETVAARHALDPDVVEAVVWTESSGNADAFRYEPNFWTRYLKNNPTYASMNPRRASSSYGLMQVMYPVAVEHGFTGQPEELFVPETSLEYGCRKLAADLKWANGHVNVALAAYNAGRGGVASTAGQAYAAKVLQVKDHA